jgi:probable HAF family extracellular repeat protein
MDEFTVDHSMRGRLRRREGSVRLRAVACNFVLGLSLAMACQSALAQALYRIKPLGDLGTCPSIPPVAYGFNAAGQVTGQACNAHHDFHAFLWKNDGTPMVDLGPAEVGSRSIGRGLNASGLVAGWAQDSTGQYGFVSSGGSMTRIADSLGGASSAAFALNDSGQVTGWADSTGGATNAFLWKNNGLPMTDLGNQSADNYYNTVGTAINASGQVAGTSGDGVGDFRAFIWRNNGTPLLDLGSLGGFRNTACCINASGQVAGDSSVMGAAHPHAFLWRDDGTGMQDLGTLARGSLSSANALNASGQVVGWSYTRFYKKPHAFIWMNDGKPMKDLGTLGGTTSQANDINTSGQVTGYAYVTGDTSAHAFLWRNDGGKIQDLNALIDTTDPLKPYVTLSSGDFINASGNIVAEGTDSRTGADGLYLLQGTVLTLNPRSLAFGNQPINTTSAAKSVTVTNTSAKAVAITSIALTGTASGQFGSTNNCGNSLAGHATCTIKVTFKPTTKGAKSAFLNVNGGGGGLRSVNLTGTGT